MEDRIMKIIQNHGMIDAIRVRQNTESNVEHLKNALGISRTTADKIISNLISEDNGPALIRKENRSTVVCAECAYYLGISIGSKYIRVALIGLDFLPVSKDDLLECEEIIELIKLDFMRFNNEESGSTGLAFLTPSSDPQNMSTSLDRLRKVISPLVSHFLKLSERHTSPDSPQYPLAGIGFAVAGPVDYTAKTWISAPHITSLRNITIQDLIGYENLRNIEERNIFMSIDNNAKTAIISEYFQLLVNSNGNYHDDLALIYIGSGIGSAAIVNGKLLRSRNNTSGEIGQMQIFFSSNANSSQNNSQSQELVPFNMKRLEELMQSSDPAEACRKWLPYALCSTVCILGIQNVILAGHSIRGTDYLIPSLMDERTKFTVASTQMYCTLGQGRNTPNTAAIGAAIEAYYTMCNYDEDKPTDRTNLAFAITM
jgi:predicted NBD/HSP70 family sugar kinase